MEDKFRIETEISTHYTEDFLEAIDIAKILSGGSTVHICKGNTVLRIIRNGNTVFEREDTLNENKTNSKK